MRIQKNLFLLILFSCFFITSCQQQKTFWDPVVLSPLIQTNPVFDLKKVDRSIEIIILNFFAPNCPPCITEMPELEKFNKIIRKKYPHVLFVPIASTLSNLELSKNNKHLFSEEHKQEIQKFVQKYHVPEPTYLATTIQLKNYRVSGFPETYILYRQKSKNSTTPFYLKRKFISNITLEALIPYIQFYQISLEENSKNYRY